jgi:hypothetical protein
MEADEVARELSRSGTPWPATGPPLGGLAARDAVPSCSVR